MKLILNGVDFSDVLYHRGIAERPIKREGDNGGIVLSGEKIVDPLAGKDIVTVTCNPMTTTRKNALKNMVKQNAYLTVTYNINEDGDDDVTITAIPSMGAAKVGLVVDGVTYWSGIILTLEEK